MDIELLNEYGIRPKKGLARCLDDVELYEAILALFLESDALSRAQDAFARADHAALFRCAHEIKGASGNAELTELYEAVCPLVDALRTGGAADTEIEERFRRMEAAYNRAREGIVRASCL